MKNKIYSFQNTDIEFIVDDNNNIKVNATQMAKVFNKQVKHFNENANTQKFITACLSGRNSDHLNIRKKKDLITISHKYGTFMHEVLALKFAAWLNPDFEVWVFTTIRNLLYEYAEAQEQSIKRTVILQQDKDKLINKLAKNNKDFRNYLSIEQELKKERSKRRTRTIKRFEQEQDLWQQSIFPH